MWGHVRPRRSSLRAARPAAAARPPRGPRGRPDRRLVLAAGQGRPRGAGAPGRRERLDRGGHGPHPAAPGGPVRRDGGPDRGERPLGPGPQGPLALRHPDPGGGRLRHPLPAAGRGPRHGGRRRRRGGPGRERAGRGARLLRPRQLRRQPRPPVAGLRHRHHRRRAVHPGLPGPGGRRRGRREDRGHLLRGGLGQRQRHRVLRPGRRGHAALPALAPPGGHRPGRRRPRPPGGRRPLLPRRGPDPGRALCGGPPGLQGDLGGVGARRRRPPGRAAGHRAPAPGDRVRRRPRAGRSGRRPSGSLPHHHQRRGRGLPPHGGT